MWEHAVEMSEAADIPFARLLRMTAAAWGTNYPADRTASGEFSMIWKRGGDGLLRLVDAADSGSGSLQVEGLYVRHLLYRNAGVSGADAGRPVTGEEFWFEKAERRLGKNLVFSLIRRSDWTPGEASPDEWERFRSDLYANFYEEGAGFFAHDLQFADLAIDWLKSGKAVTAGVCCKLN